MLKINIHYHIFVLSHDLYKKQMSRAITVYNCFIKILLWEAIILSIAVLKRYADKMKAL